MNVTFKKTGRGFGRFVFSDLYGEPCSLQQSSLATRDAIWFGCDSEKKHPETGEGIGARMHLSREQVRDLLPALQQFVDTGRLPD